MNIYDLKMSENRVSSSQLHELLDFLASHPQMANNTGLGPRERQRHDKLWEQISRSLNSHSEGAKKTGMRWKRYWADIKFKSKSRLISRRQSNGNLEDLGEVDKKVLAIISKGPKIPKLEVDASDFNTQESTCNQNKVWPTIIASCTARNENDSDPLIQFLPVNNQADEENSSEPEQTNIKNIVSKNPEFGWLIELDERRVASEEKLAEAATQMAQAAMINAEASKTIAQATLMMATNQQTILELLQKKIIDNNT